MPTQLKASTLRPEELRIGNWYENQDGTLNGVRTGRYDQIERYTDLQFAHLMLPIPLTEEWLIKFGFQADYDGNLKLHSPHLFELIQYKGLKSVGLHGYQRKILGSEIWYVHQLQNLYFALTGEELTINKDTDGS